MFKRQTSGSIVCPSCSQLVSVKIKICPNCQYKNPGLWGYGKALKKLGTDFGFTLIIIWGCITLYLASLLIDPGGISSNSTIGLLSPSSRSTIILGATGAIPVFSLGRWWTVFTSPWLHGGLFHIAFNLLWIRELAPLVARFYGSGRLIIIYTISGATGSLLTSMAGEYFGIFPSIFHGAKLAIGASGGLFGLFGALVAYGNITGDGVIREKYWILAIVFFFLGFLTPNIDNWGHLGGFLGGYTISQFSWFDPSVKETQNHLLLGLACVVITILSLVTSVIHIFLL